MATKKARREDGPPPWGTLPTELVQDVCSFLVSADLASASLTCRSWRTAACALVTHLTLPLNHPLLIAGPARGWEECVARIFAPQIAYQRRALRAGGHANGAAGSGSSVNSTAVSSGQLTAAGWDTDTTAPVLPPPSQFPPGGYSPAASSERHGLADLHGTAAAGDPGPALAGLPSAPACPAAAATSVSPTPPPLPRLRSDFPMVTHITLVHNAMLHRLQVHAALSTIRALWPTVQGLSVHDSVTWDLPLDYSALGVLTHITSLELLFQGQGGMDEAGQPMYRASMPHLCKLGQLKELCMKWIIGYDVDSFLDFNEVYDLLASLVRHGQLQSLQFGGENINAEGARHLASITSLETLNLVCDARPASPLHLLDLLTLPRLTRLELMHVCPDHAWNAPAGPGEQPTDVVEELARRSAAVAASPLRCLALSLSPGCQAMVSRALPLLRHLHSLSVRVTSSDEEEALCAAFKAMMAGPQPPQPPTAPAGGAAPAPAPPPPQPPQPHQQGTPAPPPGVRQNMGGPAAAVAGAASPTLVQLHGQGLAPGPPLRALRLETAELGPDLIASLASLTALTSLQLPRGLPTGEIVDYMPATAAAEAAAAGMQVPVLNKYTMVHLSSLGRLTCLRRLMIQLDSPADTAPAFVDGSMVSVLSGLPHLESLHLSSWNLLGVDPTPQAVGPYPELPEPAQPTPPHLSHHQHQQGAQQPGEAATASTSETSGEALGAGPGSVPGVRVTSANATSASDAGGNDDGSDGAAARRQRSSAPCMTPLPTRCWQGLRSLSLSHWPGVYGKLRDIGPPLLGRCYAVCWDDLPGCLEALLLVRCQLAGSRPPPGLRHLWLADCITGDTPLPQLLTGMTGLETLVLRWPSCQEEQEPQGEAAARQRAQLVAAVSSLKGLRTLGLGGIRCQDVPCLSPLSVLRHLMLEPLQPPRPAGEASSAQRDLTLLDQLMELPPGALSGLRTLWVPNWAMPIKQLLQWQQMLQAAMPLVVLRVTEYDVVWTVPTPVMHVARVEAPSSLSGRVGSSSSASPVAAMPERRRALWHGRGRSNQRLHAGTGLDGQELEWWHIGCWTVQ